MRLWNLGQAEIASDIKTERRLRLDGIKKFRVESRGPDIQHSWNLLGDA